MTLLSRLIYITLFTTLLLTGRAVSAAQLPDFTDIVKQSSPAVVKIIVEASGPRAGQAQPAPEEIPEYIKVEGREGCNSGINGIYQKSTKLHEGKHYWKKSGKHKNTVF